MEAFLLIAIIAVWLIYVIAKDRPFDGDKTEYVRQQCNETVERAKSNAELRREQWIARRTPIYAKLITVPETKYTGYGKYKAVKRALIGDLLFGTPGAFLGPMTTPENDRTTVTVATFLVRYKDGHAGNETVDIKGGRCRELLAVLDEAQADELLTRFGGSSLPF